MKKVILFLLIALLINDFSASENDATSLITNDNPVETIQSTQIDTEINEINDKETKVLC